MFERKKTYAERFPVSTVYREVAPLILEGSDIPVELQGQIKKLCDADFINLQSRPHFSTPINSQEEKYIKTGKKIFPTGGQPLQPQRPIDSPELLKPSTALQEVNNSVSSAINSFVGFNFLKLI